MAIKNQVIGLLYELPVLVLLVRTNDGRVCALAWGVLLSVQCGLAWGVLPSVQCELAWGVLPSVQCELAWGVLLSVQCELAWGVLPSVQCELAPQLWQEWKGKSSAVATSDKAGVKCDVGVFFNPLLKLWTGSTQEGSLTMEGVFALLVEVYEGWKAASGLFTLDALNTLTAGGRELQWEKNVTWWFHRVHNKVGYFNNWKDWPPVVGNFNNHIHHNICIGRLIWLIWGFPWKFHYSNNHDNYGNCQWKCEHRPSMSRDENVLSPYSFDCEV